MINQLKVLRRNLVSKDMIHMILIVRMKVMMAMVVVVKERIRKVREKKKWRQNHQLVLVETEQE